MSWLCPVQRPNACLWRKIGETRPAASPPPSPHLVLTTKNCLAGSKLPPHSFAGSGQVLTQRVAVMWAEAQLETLMWKAEVSSLQLSKGGLGALLVEELADNSGPPRLSLQQALCTNTPPLGPYLGSLWHQRPGSGCPQAPWRLREGPHPPLQAGLGHRLLGYRKKGCGLLACL